VDGWIEKLASRLVVKASKLGSRFFLIRLHAQPRVLHEISAVVADYSSPAEDETYCDQEPDGAPMPNAGDDKA
jgi:hypothetical protein